MIRRMENGDRKVILLKREKKKIRKVGKTVGGVEGKEKM